MKLLAVELAHAPAVVQAHVEELRLRAEQAVRERDEVIVAALGANDCMAEGATVQALWSGGVHFICAAVRLNADADTGMSGKVEVVSSGRVLHVFAQWADKSTKACVVDLIIENAELKSRIARVIEASDETNETSASDAIQDMLAILLEDEPDGLDA